jgi:hypothetical protein
MGTSAPSGRTRLICGFPGLKPWAESCSHLRGINHPDLSFLNVQTAEALRAWLLSACPSRTNAILPSKRLRVILALMPELPAPRLPAKRNGLLALTGTDRHCSEWTVSAAVTATSSALEMVSRRKDDIPILVEIEVFLHRGWITRFA